MKNRLKNYLKGRTLKQAFIDSRFHQWLRNDFKPIPLCWWFEKHNLPVPKYLVGHSTFTLSQVSYRFRNDDGTETGATWLAAQNTTWAYTGGVYKEFRLRVELQETGGASGSASDVLQYSINGGAFATVPTGGGAAVFLTGMTWVADGTATTNQNTIGTGTFSAGQIRTTSTAAASTMAASGQTEHEFGMAVDPSVLSPGTTTITFRILDSGGTITYSQTPTMTVYVAPPTPTGSISAQSQYKHDRTPLSTGSTTSTDGAADNLYLNALINNTNLLSGYENSYGVEVQPIGNNFTGTPNYSGNSFQPQEGSLPTAMRGCVMTYDSVNKRFIMTDGYDGTTRFNDLWELDASGMSAKWKKLSPTGTPLSGRNLGSAIQINQNGKSWMFHYGGNVGASDSNELSIVDCTVRGSESYTTVTQTNSPSARSYTTLHLAAVPTSANTTDVYFFGGWASTRENILAKVTVDTSGAVPTALTWTTVTANGAAGSPPGRSGCILYYDAPRNRLVVHGGYGSSGLNDTWAYSLSSPGWSQLSPTGTLPTGRELFAAAFDPTSQRLVVAAGWSTEVSTNNRNDIYQIDFSSSADGVITELKTNDYPDCDVSPFSSMATAYDPNRRMFATSGVNGYDGTDRYSYAFDFTETVVADKMTLYGLNIDDWQRARDAPAYCVDVDFNEGLMINGFSGMPDDTLAANALNGDHMNEIWAYDFANNKVRYANAGIFGMVYKEGVCAVYDTVGDRVIAYGGLTGASQVTGGVWELKRDAAGNYKARKMYPTGTAPSPRWLMAGGFDATHNRAIFWGGTTASAMQDSQLHILDFSGGGDGAWTAVTAGGTTPPVVWQPGYANDTGHSKLYVCSGATNFGASTFSTRLDYLDYSTSTPSWVNVNTTGVTGARGGVLMYAPHVDTTDPGTLWFFGGYNGSTVNNQLLWLDADGAGTTWTSWSGISGLPAARRSAAGWVYKTGGIYNSIHISSGRPVSGQWFRDVEAYEVNISTGTGFQPGFTDKAPPVYQQRAVLVAGLAPNTNYHWQAINTVSATSFTDAYAGNSESATDFGIGTPATYSPTTFTATAILSNTGGGTTYVTLWNRTDNVQVSGTEMTSTSSTPEFKTIDFEVGVTGFADLKDYEFRTKATSGTTANVYSARLYVHLKNLTKALTYNRVSRFGFQALSSAAAATSERWLYESSHYSSPSAVWEVTGVEDTNGTNNFQIYDVTTTDSGTTGSGISTGVDVNTISKTRARVTGVSLTDTHRYMGIFNYTSGGARYHQGLIGVNVSGTSGAINIATNTELLDSARTSMTTGVFTPINSKTPFNYLDYDGTVTHYWEVIGTNSVTSAQNVVLVAVNASGATTDIATITMTASTGSSNVRYRSGALSIPSGTTFLQVRIPKTATAQQVSVQGSRIVTVQSNASRTRIQIPMSGSNNAINDDTSFPNVTIAQTTYASLANNVDQFTIWHRDDSEFATYSGASSGITATVTHTTDALKRKAGTKTHTTDANKKKSGTVFHTTSSNKKVSGLTRTHSTDSFLRKQVVKTHSTDANKKKAALTKFHTTDANKKKAGNLKTHTTDANKKKSLTKTHTTDSFLRKQQTKFHTTDSNKKSSGLLRTHSTDSLKRKQNTLSHTTDTYTHIGVQTITQTHTTDALKRQQLTKTHTTDALKRKQFALTHSTDANKKKAGVLRTHTTDSLKRKTAPIFHTTDSNKKKAGIISHTTSANLKKSGITRTHTTDSFIRKSWTKTHTTDALKRKQLTLVHSADANKRISGFTKTHTTDSNKKKSFTKFHTTDFLKRKSSLLSHTTDSNKRKTGLTKTHTTDSLKTYPLLQTLTDNFNDNSLNSSLWSPYFAGPGTSTVTEQNQRLEINMTASGGGGGIFDYPGMGSVNYYSAVGSYISTQVTAVPPSTSNRVAWMAILVNGGTSPRWYYSAGNLIAQSTPNGGTSPTTYATIAYNATTMAFWRIREASGVFYWETSPDNSTWTVRYSGTPVGFVSPTKVQVYYEMDSGGADVSANFFLDNVNTGAVIATKTHSTDSLLRKQTTASHTTDSLKRKANTLSHTTSSNKRVAGNTRTHTTDAFKRKQSTISHTTDANKKKTTLKTHTTDALKRISGILKTHTTDALLRRAITKSHTTDSLKRKLNTLSHTTDSNKRLATVKTHTTSANLKKSGITRIHTTDSFLRKQWTKAHTTDSLKRKATLKTHTADALKHATTTKAHTTDSFKSLTATVGPNNPSSATDSGSGFDAWNNPGNVYVSDDTYASATIGINAGWTNFLIATGFGFNIPAGATINGIKMEFERHASTGVSDKSLKLVKGGVATGTDKAAGASWPASDAYASYGSTSDLWGTTWTVADINSSNFGVSIQAGGTGGFQNASIDHIRISVTYTPGIPTVTHATDANKRKAVTVTHTTSANKKTVGLLKTHTTDAHRVAISSSGAHSPSSGTNDASTGTLAWVNPGNILSSDNTYAYVADISPAASNYLKGTNFGFSIPTGATIRGIKVEIEKFASSNGVNYVNDYRMRIIKSDGSIGTTDKADTVSKWGTSDSYYTYGSSTDLWGETWNPADINDVDFGAAFAASINPDTTVTGYVDHMRITVYYTTTIPSFTTSHTTSSFLRKQVAVVHTTDSLKRKSNALAHTTDSNKKKATVVSHTTDANRKRAGVLKTHTTDALKRKQNTLSHTTSANTRKSALVSHTTDALKKKAGLTLTHTTDSFLRKQFTNTHTTDAFKRTANTRVHTTDSLKRKANTVVHTTDALKREANVISHSTDANKKKAGLTKFHTTDANKRTAGLTRFHTTDSLKRTANTRSHTTDAFKRVRVVKTHTTDSLLRKTVTKTHSTDANLKKAGITRVHTTDVNKRKPGVAVSHTTDALKRKTNVLTHLTDAFKRIVTTKTHTTDSFLRKQFVKTHTTDANKRKAYTIAHTTDANKKKVGNLVVHTTDALRRTLNVKTHTTDALKRVTHALSHTTNALIRKNIVKTHTTDSNKRKATVVSHSTDSNKKKADNLLAHTTDALKKKVGLVRTHTTDSLLRQAHTLSHTTSSLKRKINSVSHTTDAFKRSGFMANHNTDANKRKLTLVSHTTDSNKKKAANLLTHTTDALLRTANVVSHATDALKRSALALTHTTDALVRKGNLVSHTTDTLKRTLNAISHTTDSFLRKAHTLSHTTDANKKLSGNLVSHTTSSNKRKAGVLATHTTDAFKRKANTLAHTTDANKRKATVVFHTTDSLIRKLFSKFHLTDANKRKATLASHTTDANKRKGLSVSHSTDANKKIAGNTVSHTTNVLLRRARTILHTTDALKRTVNTKSHTTDSFLRKARTVSHTTSANLKKTLTKLHKTDAFKRSGTQLFMNTDANLRKADSVFHTADASKYVVHTVEHTTDAFLRVVHAITHATDSLLRISTTLSHSTDSNLRKSHTKSHTTDAFTRKGNERSHLTDANKRKTAVVSHTTDSNKRKPVAISHTTDAFLRLRSTVSHTTDAVLRKVKSVFNRTDANKRKAGLVVSHTTSSNLRGYGSVSHSTDAFLKQRHTVSHSTDSFLRKARTVSHATDANKKRGQTVSHNTDASLSGSFITHHSTDAYLFARRGNKQVLENGQWQYGVVYVLVAGEWVACELYVFDGTSWNLSEQ